MMRKRTRGYLKSISLKKQKLKSVTIEDLPNEMLEKIFAYLNIRSRGDCAQISKRFKSFTLSRLGNSALSVECKTLHLRHSKIVFYYVDFGIFDTYVDPGSAII